MIYEMVIGVNDMKCLIPEEMFLDCGKLSEIALGGEYKNKAVIIMDGEGSQRHSGVNAA